jgi:hypothetical protein
MQKPVVEPPQEVAPARTWWIGAGSQWALVGKLRRATSGRVREARSGGHGECLRRSRGEAAGEELGTYPVDRLMVNVGTVARSPYLSVSQADSGKACRLLMVWQRGGGSVVVRGRESRPHGEGTQRVRSCGTGMPEGRR